MTDISLNKSGDNLTIESFECQFPNCSSFFNDMKSLEEHMNECHIEKFKCKECDISCKTRDDLKLHNNSFHSENNFDSLVKEIFEKDSESVETTPILDEYQNLFLEFDENENQGTNETPGSHQNNVNSSSVTVKAQIVRRYESDCHYLICNFSSEDPNAMLDHLNRFHSSPNLFVCHKCRTRFIRRSDLIRHRQKSHSDFSHEILFKCYFKDCDLETFDEFKYKKHDKKHRTLLRIELRKKISKGIIDLDESKCNDFIDQSLEQQSFEFNF